jgi:hypothetical protein
MRLTCAAYVLKGGHEVIADLRDQSGSARTRMRQAPDAERVDRIRGAVWSATLRQARTALWRPSRHGGLTPHPCLEVFRHLAAEISKHSPAAIV